MNILCSLYSTVVAVGIGTILDWFPNYCTPFVTSDMFRDIFMIPIQWMSQGWTWKGLAFKEWHWTYIIHCSLMHWSQLLQHNNSRVHHTLVIHLHMGAHHIGGRLIFIIYHNSIISVISKTYTDDNHPVQFTLDDHRHLFICGVSPPSIEAAEQCLLYRGRSTILLMPPPVGLQHTTRQQSILQQIFDFFQFPKCTLVLCDTGVLGKVLVFVVCRALPQLWHIPLQTTLVSFLQTRTLLSLEHCSSGAAALSTLYFSEKRAMLAE